MLPFLFLSHLLPSYLLPLTFPSFFVDEWRWGHFNTILSCQGALNEVGMCVCVCVFMSVKSLCVCVCVCVVCVVYVCKVTLCVCVCVCVFGGAGQLAQL